MLADGQWHGKRDLIVRGTAGVPPELFARFHLHLIQADSRRRRKTQRLAPTPAQNDMEHLVRFGKKRVAEAVLTDWRHKGIVERMETSGELYYRLVQKHLTGKTRLWSCLKYEG